MDEKALSLREKKERRRARRSPPSSSSGCAHTICAHSFASLLIAEGRSVVEVAAHMGHAPAMTLDTYGHVIAELAGKPSRPADELIAQARECGARLARANEARLTRRRKPA